MRKQIVSSHGGVTIVELLIGIGIIGIISINIYIIRTNIYIIIINVFIVDIIRIGIIIISIIISTINN